MDVKKILIAIALLSLVATNAEAHGGGWHGHRGGGYYGGGGPFLFFGALAGLTIPFYYSQLWSGPGPYYYPSTPVYVQNPPGYVVADAQPRTVVTQSPGNGVIELGPVNALPPASSDSAPSSDSDQAPSGQWFAYPSRGQSPQQQANDHYECNKWAVNESGYDPDLRTHRNPETGPVAYGRALSACLEGRGYAVR